MSFIGGRTVKVSVWATCTHCKFQQRIEVTVPMGTKKVSPPNDYYCGAQKCLAARELTPQAVRTRIAEFIDVSRKNPGLLTRMLANGSLPDGACREIISHAEQGGEMAEQISEFLLLVAKEHLARGNASALKALRARRASVAPNAKRKGSAPSAKALEDAGDSIAARS